MPQIHTHRYAFAFSNRSRLLNVNLHCKLNQICCRTHTLYNNLQAFDSSFRLSLCCIISTKYAWNEIRQFCYFKLQLQQHSCCFTAQILSYTYACKYHENFAFNKITNEKFLWITLFHICIHSYEYS